MMKALTLLISFILINAISCQKPTKKIYICVSDNTVCYKKLANSELQKVEDRVVKFNDFTNLEYFVKFELKSPPELGDNKYGNPFPTLKIDISVNMNALKRESFLKIKNVHKDKESSIANSSLLEGDYPFPYMIIVFPLNSDINYKDEFVFYADKLESRAALNFNYYQSSFEFFVNQYIDVFKNVIKFDFVCDISMADLKGTEPKQKVEFFKHNLNVYRDICKTFRTSTGQDAQEFRDKETKNYPAELKEKFMNLSMIEWFRATNNMGNLGSACFQLEDPTNFDLTCLKEKNGCDLFFRLEKLSLTKYQYHLFTRKDVGYMKVSFFSSKNIDVRYEIVCTRFSRFTDHYIKKNKIETEISATDLDANNFNRSLIYSVNGFFYCGIQILIESSFKLGSETFNFEMSNGTQVEFEYGKFLTDGKTRSQNWVKQIPIDFSVWVIQYPVLEVHMLLISAATGVVIILFVCVSCWMCNKFQTLSKGLTKVGSRLSNMSVISDMSATSAADRSERPKKKDKGSVLRSIFPTSELESTLASKGSKKKGNSHLSSNRSRRSSASKSSHRSVKPSAYSSANSSANASSDLHSNATSVRMSTNKPSSSRSEASRSQRSSRGSAFKSSRNN